MWFFQFKEGVIYGVWGRKGLRSGSCIGFGKAVRLELGREVQGEGEEGIFDYRRNFVILVKCNVKFFFLVVS